MNISQFLLESKFLSQWFSTPRVWIKEAIRNPTPNFKILVFVIWFLKKGWPQKCKQILSIFLTIVGLASLLLVVVIIAIESLVISILFHCYLLTSKKLRYLACVIVDSRLGISLNHLLNHLCLNKHVFNSIVTINIKSSKQFKS